MDKRFNEKLAEEAKRAGICREWYGKILQAADIPQLLALYVSGIDFCLSNEYPNNRILKEYGGEYLPAFGIYVDEENAELQNPRRLIALGTTRAAATFREYAMGEVFAKHSAEVAVSAQNNSFVVIDMFDESRVTVKTFGNAKVCIHQYGGTLSTESAQSAVIKVIDKHKTTY